MIMKKIIYIGFMIFYSSSVFANHQEQIDALYTAIMENKINEVQKLLKEGVDVNAESDAVDRETPLHLAVEKGHLDIVTLLLEHGANIEARYDGDPFDGYSPLSIAVLKGHLDIAKLLLDHGANTETRDICNGTPLHHTAHCWGHLVDHAKLLLDRGAHVDAQDCYGNTTMHFAAGNDNLLVIQVLIAYGAKIDISNAMGQTPLDYAYTDGFRSAMLKVYQDKVDREHTDRLRSAIANCHVPSSGAGALLSMIIQHPLVDQMAFVTTFADHMLRVSKYKVADHMRRGVSGYHLQDLVSLVTGALPEAYINDLKIKSVQPFAKYMSDSSNKQPESASAAHRAQ